MTTAETPGFPTMRQLDDDLEKLWLTVKEEQYRSDQYNTRLARAGMLNSAAIILLCVAVMILFYVMQKEVLPMLNTKGEQA
jgi:hypothetical protein